MSTYNGQDYLIEQIQSILNQTNHEWHLYIRDDGSSDKTCKIIQSFAQKYNCITFINDKNRENVGVVRSFMRLLQVIKADFYMFSDQDDVWLPNKVQITLNRMLQCHYQSLPVCVHTNLEVVDNSLKKYVSASRKLVWSSFQRLLFWNCVTGCTIMVNQKLKNMIKFKNMNYDNIYMHDWWIALIAAEFGEISFINKSTMLYRQHGNNVEGSLQRHSVKEVIYRLTNYDYDRANMKKIILIANEFYCEYNGRLSLNDELYVKEYGNLVKNSSFGHNLILAIKLPPRERTKKGMLFFSFLMVFFNKDLLKKS